MTRTAASDDMRSKHHRIVLVQELSEQNFTLGPLLAKQNASVEILRLSFSDNFF